MVATQADIFGNVRAVDPLGKRHSLEAFETRCNLCCMPFGQTEIAPIGRFFYLGFHVCERCKFALDEAEFDKAEGRKIVRFLCVEFYTKNAITNKVIAVTVDGKVSGYIGKSHYRAQGMGRKIGKRYNIVNDDTAVSQLFDIASDMNITHDGALARQSYRFDNMIAEMYDNISYNRLDFSDVEG